MKKAVFFLAALFAAAAAAADVTLGARAGADVNIFDFECGNLPYNLETDSAAGFDIHIFTNIGIPFVERLGVQPEVGFHYRNTKGSWKYQGQSGDFENEYMTLDIPVMVNYRYDVTKWVFVQPEIGPKFSFLLGDYGGDLSIGADDLKSFFNVGINIGIVVGVNVGQRGAVIFDIRYDRDFTKVVSTAGADDDERGATQSVNLTIGYQHRIK